jgi:predicted transcriptional regulator
MTRTLTIKIKSIDDALEDFRKSFRAAETGHRVSRREGVYFTSIEAARTLLTPSRLALLRAIRHHRPDSIYELAKIVQRDLKNVQGDLKILTQYGLVTMTKTRGPGRRQIKTPRSDFGHIALKIAL